MPVIFYRGRYEWYRPDQVVGKDRGGEWEPEMKLLHCRTKRELVVLCADQERLIWALRREVAELEKIVHPERDAIPAVDAVRPIPIPRPRNAGIDTHGKGVIHHRHHGKG